LLFPGNIVTLSGLIEAPSLASGPARPLSAVPRPPTYDEGHEGAHIEEEK